MHTTQKRSDTLVEFEHEVILDPTAAFTDANGKMTQQGSPPVGDPLWRLQDMTADDRAACVIVGIQPGGGVLTLATVEHDQDEATHIFEATSGAHKEDGDYGAFVLRDGAGDELFRHHVDPPAPVKTGQKLRVAFLFRVGMPGGADGASLGAAAKVEAKDVETE